jgi:hypothetical protein
MIRTRSRGSRPVGNPGVRTASAAGDALRGDDRGGVYFESVIALPILILFFSWSVQLTYLSIASLLVKHAAVAAARSAAVVIPDCPSAFADGSPPGTLGGERLAAVQKAATAVIVALDYLPLLWPAGSAGVTAPDVSVDLAGSGVGLVVVSFPAPCTVPLGGWIICGGASKTITASATFPVQGASYAYY